MICSKCKHSSVAMLDSGGEQSGERGLICRLNPPQCVAVGGLTPQGIAAQVLTVWPTVKPGDRCASYAPEILNA